MEHVVDLGGLIRLRSGFDVDLPGRGRSHVRYLRGRGRRPTVVLLHGWAATADLNWGGSYAALGRHFDVVGIDHRGHGRGPRREGRFTLEDCADDVAAVVGALGCGPAIIAGYSMGGPIAQLVWRRHPASVAGLVLCATSDVFCDSTRDRALFAAATGAATIARSMPSKVALRFVGAQLARRHRLLGALGSQVLAHDWAQVLDAAHALGSFDSRSWLPSVDVPVATVTTLRDSVVQTSRQRAMAATLPLVAEQSVDGGHLACLRSGSGFVAALVGACRTVAGAQSSAGLRPAG